MPGAGSPVGTYEGVIWLRHRLCRPLGQDFAAVVGGEVTTATKSNHNQVVSRSEIPWKGIGFNFTPICSRLHGLADGGQNACLPPGQSRKTLLPLFLGLLALVPGTVAELQRRLAE